MQCSIKISIKGGWLNTSLLKDEMHVIEMYCVIYIHFYLLQSVVVKLF